MVIKSSYCQGCTFWKNKQNTEKYVEWYKNHRDECIKNHEGSAGKMEVDVIVQMFSRSEEKFGVRNGNYKEDGDSKTFIGILHAKPYDFLVIKSECIG